ncbi:MAG: hypothetical protein EP312_00685 [Gammaproteobacteria bacterium]|nr:MAG: hypothetical protein EP312_00685 [Gammaproteobacteria bacterium]
MNILTEEQVLFFKVFGFLHLPGLFLPEIQSIQDAFDKVIEDHPDEKIEHLHEAHYNAKRIMMPRFIEKCDLLTQLLSDPRITSIAQSLCGEDYNYFSSDGNIFSGDTIWHRDSYGLVRRHKYTKFLFYLDPIKADSGALRVIPGSHHQGQHFSKILHDILSEPEQQLGVPAKEVPSQVVETTPGDLIVFDYNIQHATCDSRFPRRMFSIGFTEYFPEAKKQQAIDSIRQRVADYGRIYSEAILQSGEPAIRDHIQQILALEAIALQQLGSGESQ